MNHKQAFGAALREQRKRGGLSQDALAHEAGLDRTYISTLELGQKSPTLDTIVKLSEALGVRVSALANRMEELLSNENGR